MTIYLVFSAFTSRPIAENVTLTNVKYSSKILLHYRRVTTLQARIQGEREGCLAAALLSNRN
jgi:hypothetical protein